MLYKVHPDSPIRGGWFIRNYVLNETAHRYGNELLLWDGFGVMSQELDGDLGLIDEVAALLLAADAGDDDPSAGLPPGTPPTTACTRPR